MTFDLEDRLRQDLSALADRVPRTPDALDQVRPLVRRRRHRHVALTAAGGLGVAVVTLGALANVLPGTNPDRSAAFVPTGIGSPLVYDATAAPPSGGPLIRPGSFVQLGRPGLQDLQIYDSVMFYEGHAVKVHCTAEPFAGSGCDPYLDQIPQSTSITSTVDSGAGTTNSWIWSGLPAEAVFVEFTDGDVSLWQQPFAGVAAFPVSGEGAAAYDAGSGVAYDAQGAVVASSEEIDPSAHYPLFPPFDWSQITEAEKDQTWIVIDSAMKACLAVSGDDAWDRCVEATDQTVMAWISDRAAQG